MGRGKSGPITYSTDGVFGTSAVFEGLAALAILITAFFALIRIRINRDAARKCFYWLYGVMAVLITSYLLSMTASAIYTYLFSSSALYLDDERPLLLDARRLEPVGRCLRRVGGAVCGVMLVKVAASIGLVVGYAIPPLPSACVYVTSAIASVLALAECIAAEVFLNGPGNVLNRTYSLPRLDDQFNGSSIAMVLGAVAVLTLSVGAVAAAAVVWGVNRAAGKFRELEVVVALMMSATIVFFVVRFWGIAEVPLLLRPRRQDTSSLAWFYIADGLMDRVGMFLVVLLVYYIGVRKKEGLWSSSPVENRS